MLYNAYNIIKKKRKEYEGEKEKGEEVDIERKKSPPWSVGINRVKGSSEAQCQSSK